MQRIIPAVKKAAAWLSNLSIWYRILLGTALGALGGSTFVGFISTYAVYNYAYRFGARVPVEGVPYVGLASSVISFAFLFVSLSCATLVYAMLLLLSKLFRWLFDMAARTSKEVTETLRNSKEARGERAISWIQDVGAKLLASLTTAISAALPLFDRAQEASGTGGRGLPNILESPTLIVTIIITAGILALAALRPHLVKWIAACFTIILVGSITVALFLPPVYSGLLRFIRYGGGTAVAISCSSRVACVENEPLNLFLRTSDVYILYAPKSGEFIEVPKEEVRRIHYRPRPQHALPPVQHESKRAPAS